MRLGIPPAPPVGTPPTPVPPFDCGDANADGQLNISDAVYIQNFLFLGGPPPCRVDGVILKTGITHCYNESGNGNPMTTQVTCLPPTAPTGAAGGQDGFFQTGLSRSFQSNGDGTVLDLTTGLTWIADPVTVTIQNSGDVDGSIPWEQALSFCQGLSFADHDDWRLPNVNELESMINYGREGTTVNDPIPKIYSQFFTLPAATGICMADGVRVSIPVWTSTTSTALRTMAFAINFADGMVHNDKICNIKTNNHFVWPVRGGLDP